MSYTVSTPGAKPRPGTVTAASRLLYLCAALQITSLAVGLVSLGPVMSALEGFGSGDQEKAFRTATIVALVVGLTVSLIFAIGTGVLGSLVGKGKNAARIVTWVLGGIGVLCYGCGLVGTAVQGSLTGLNTDAQAQDLQRRLEEATPAWQGAASTALQVVMLLTLVTVIVLLALPSAGDYFRKEQQVWVPPTYPPSYPPSQ